MRRCATRWKSIVRGSQCTAAQDLEFSIRELVEIALRALSPGINDPATAIAVIDRLGKAMALVLRRAPARGEWYDAAGTLRVIARPPTTAGLFDAAWNQIRQAGESQAAILIRLVETMAKLAELVCDEEQAEAIRIHSGMILEGGRRHLHEPRDLAELEAHGERVRHRLVEAQRNGGVRSGAAR